MKQKATTDHLLTVCHNKFLSFSLTLTDVSSHVSTKIVVYCCFFIKKHLQSLHSAGTQTKGFFYFPLSSLKKWLILLKNNPAIASKELEIKWQMEDAKYGQN